MSGNADDKKSIFSYIKEYNSILYLLISFFILLIISIGITFSYAFWISSDEQTGQNEVTAGCLSFTYNDKHVAGNTTSISLSNTYPVSDTKGLSTTPYVFTITNTCNLKASMDIFLHTLSTSNLSSGYIKLNMSSTNSAFTLGPIIISTLTSKSLDTQTTSNISTSVGSFKETYLLNTITLEPDASVTYNVNLWIDENASNDIMGKTYTGAISVMATPTK